MKNRALLLLQLVLLATCLVSLAAPAAHFARRTIAEWQSKSTWDKLDRSAPVDSGDPIAWLRIPDLSVDSMVLLDASKTNLEKHPCVHVSSLTEDAPVLLMGHRDTHFRELRNLETGYSLNLELRNGEIQRYVVSASQVIGPEEVPRALAKATPDSIVLMTCWPFDFIGPAPKRILFHADPQP